MSRPSAFAAGSMISVLEDFSGSFGRSYFSEALGGMRLKISARDSLSGSVDGAESSSRRFREPK